MRISDGSSDVCSSDLAGGSGDHLVRHAGLAEHEPAELLSGLRGRGHVDDDHRELAEALVLGVLREGAERARVATGDRERVRRGELGGRVAGARDVRDPGAGDDRGRGLAVAREGQRHGDDVLRSEEHTSELQSLMRISYAVFCLKKKTQPEYTTHRY